MVNHEFTKSGKGITEGLSAPYVAHEGIYRFLRYGKFSGQQKLTQFLGTGRKELADSQGEYKKARSRHALQT